MDDALVVGLDAAGKRGWVGIALRGGRFESAHVFGTLHDAVDREEFSCVGVDIPIIRDDVFPRPADRAAREFVGTARRSSVFMAPPLTVFEAPDFTAAQVVASATIGQGVSRQTFGLQRKVLEAAELTDVAHLYEAHPEVSFREMAGSPLQAPKKSWEGQRLRRRLLADHGIVLPDDLGAANMVPVDDILDAAAVAWTADRIARGCAGRLPEDEPDSPDSIWY